MNFKSVFALIFSFVLGSTGFCQATPLSDLYDVKSAPSSPEYVFRPMMRDNLIAVHVLGAVTRPGIYYVPPKTDLMKLLTLAGGPTVSADPDLLVRKSENSWSQFQFEGLQKDGLSYQVDVEKILKESQYSHLTMSQQDVIFIPQKKAVISQDMYRTVSLVSLVTSIVLTAVLIDRYSTR